MKYEIIIRNGKIVDGTGSPWYTGDVAVDGGRIVKIGNLQSDLAAREIDASGKIVSPGFIDTHTHYDLVPFEFAEFLYPLAEDKLLQGVTTVITGCCGNSMAPVTNENKGAWLKRRTSRNIERHEEAHWNSFAEYFSELEKRPLGINFASYVGHTTIRFNVLGLSDQKPTRADMEHMKELLRQSLKEGAIGLSSGLIYAPAVFSEHSELVELASVLSEFNAPFASHLRNEENNWIEATKEMIDIVEKNHIPGQIHHVKIMHQKNSEALVKEFMDIVYETRERGVDITFDLYPYDAVCIGMEALLLPAWVREGNERAMIARLTDPTLHDRIIEDICRFRRYERYEDMLAGCEKMLVVIAKNNEHLVGKNLCEISIELNMSPLDCAIKIMVESDITAMVVNFAMHPNDISTFVRSPLTMIGSDSVPVKAGWGAHPRNSGTFPRVIRKYVREDNVITLENAVYKMTGFPATRFQFSNRGLIKEEFYADITIFDKNEICDTATYVEPLNTPKGVEYVLVNGCIAVAEGKITGNTGGRILRRGEP